MGNILNGIFLHPQDNIYKSFNCINKYNAWFLYVIFFYHVPYILYIKGKYIITYIVVCFNIIDCIDL